MGIWLTLCWICDTSAHVSQCDWRGSLGKVYLPFYDHISHFLSQFLTEFSIVSLLSPALAATLLPMAPDCMSWHHTESEERLMLVINLRAVLSRIFPLPSDPEPGRHSACGRAPATPPPPSPRRTPRGSSRLKCQHIRYLLRWQEDEIVDTDQVLTFPAPRFFFSVSWMFCRITSNTYSMRKRARRLPTKSRSSKKLQFCYFYNFTEQPTNVTYQ